MAVNVIQKAKIDDHSIKPYRFKVLGSNMAEQSPVQADEYVSEELFELAETSRDEIVNITRIEEGSQTQFIEELLKKTDELTTNVIKLQIQIEKQEQDFNNRLSEELIRERENAYTQGYQKAKEESELLVNEVKSRYFRSISQVDELYKSIDERFVKMESDLNLSALEIAKEVVKKEINYASSEVALSISRELLKDIKNATKIELRVNPKDAEAFKGQYGEDERVRVSADDAIALGGVVVLSDVGNFDGNVAVRLEKIKYLLQEN